MCNCAHIHTQAATHRHTIHQYPGIDRVECVSIKGSLWQQIWQNAIQHSPLQSMFFLFFSVCVSMSVRACPWACKSTAHLLSPPFSLNLSWDVTRFFWGQKAVRLVQTPMKAISIHHDTSLLNLSLPLTEYSTWHLLNYADCLMKNYSADVAFYKMKQQRGNLVFCFA